MLLTACAALACPGTVVADEEKGAAFRAHDRAIHLLGDEWLRDPFITRHGGWFYLTATRLEHITGWVQGIEIWRSENLLDWEPLDTFWTFDRSAWIKDAKKKSSDEDVWLLAPEIYFLKNQWVAVHGTSLKQANLLHTIGGEYNDSWYEPFGADFGKRREPSIFTDSDGTPWLVYDCAKLVPLKPDFSAFAGDEISIGPSDRKLGEGGCGILKISGKYVLFGSAWSTGKSNQGTFNLYYCTADKVNGPYGERRFAGRFCGGGSLFQDKQGRWWTTAHSKGTYEADPVKGRKSCGAGGSWTVNPEGLTLVPLDVMTQDDGEVLLKARPEEYRKPGPEEAQEF